MFDPGNLRLLETAEGAIQATPAPMVGQDPIQAKIYSIITSNPRFEISSLAASIVHNTFLRHENLIVAPYDGSHFLVLEGNRRLAAVRTILETYRTTQSQLPVKTRNSLLTLPCFVLEGEPIGDSQEKLDEYRRASEIYIGMRHLMGAKSWEPASRYEFQARLIEEGWSAQEISERFARNKSEVLRELKAHYLYRDFLTWEKGQKLRHSITTYRLSDQARQECASLGVSIWSMPELVYYVLAHAPDDVFDSTNSFAFVPDKFRKWFALFDGANRLSP